MDLSTLDRATAELVQRGLASLGFYDGTFRGLPGPLTQAAYDKYLATKAEAPAGSLPEKLVALASAEVGVREEPMDSNRGKRVEEYQAATWLDGSGWPWCAAFICWLFKRAGVPESWRPRTAGAWDFENWARKSGGQAELLKPGRHRIKAGDIVVFRFSHIGLAEKDQRGDAVETIEGNTDASGSREGGGVYRKIRKVSQVRSMIRVR